MDVVGCFCIKNEEGKYIFEIYIWCNCRIYVLDIYIYYRFQEHIYIYIS